MTTTFTTFPQHILSCNVVATTNFSSTYAQGPNGNAIGATLTAAAAGVTTIDDVVLTTNMSILMAGQTEESQNGPYLVRQAGTATLPTILVRRDDFNSSGQFNGGYALTISGGTAGGGSVFVLEDPIPGDIGVDAAVFSSAATGAGVYLQISNNLSDLANAATARTNLGLGTAATKAASDNTKASVASVTAATTLGAVLTAADIAGTVGTSTANFRAQTANFAGGSATATITDANITTSSIVHVTIAASTNAVTIQKVTRAAGSAAVLMSADPGAATVFMYTVTIAQ